MLTTPPMFGRFRCVCSQFIFADQDPKNLTAAVTVETQLYGRELHSLPQWQKLTCLPAWSTVNSQLYGQTSTPEHHGQTPTSQHHGLNSTSQHHGLNSTESFSKSSKFSAHLFWV